MIQEIWELFTNRPAFFGELLLEHIGISLFAILIAVLIGGLAGVLISEFQRAARPTLGVINFLYTIPSISMLGFLIPFSGVGNATAVIALTIYALLPMVRNTHTGITGVVRPYWKRQGEGGAHGRRSFSRSNCRWPCP